MDVVIVPAIFSNTPKLEDDVHRAARRLGNEVVGIKFTLGFDSMGFASIFFNVTLANDAINPSRLRQITQQVALTLMNELHTDENGVHAYFNFRSHAEVAQMHDPAWAAVP